MQKFIFWTVVLAAILGFLYLFSDIISPFFVAFVFAYILQPIIEAISKKLNLSRSSVSIIVFLIFISLLFLVILMLIPLIYDQVSSFISKIPKYREYFQGTIDILIGKINNFDQGISEQISETAKNALNTVFSLLSGITNHIWDYTLATINLFTFMALVPIILYYFIRDWNKIVEKVDILMPAHGKGKIREIITSINDLLSGYIRGQLNVCLLLCIYYVLGLSIIGVDLALLIGIISGFFIIIPFIGTIISMMLAFISCYVGFGFGTEFMYVIGLYIVGYLAEGYFLTPKIIGNRIGLHPVWIMFTVFAAGSVLGFIGILFAIPIAGIIKVLISNLIDYYKKTDFYNQGKD